MSGTDRVGSYHDDDNKIMLKQIMLRFRPIAPKPVTDGGSGSGYSDLDNNSNNKLKDVVVGKKRVKRRYVRVKNKKINDINSNSKGKEESTEETAVTLELLPRSGEDRENSTAVVQVGGWENDLLNKKGLYGVDLISGGVESWVTVECVTTADTLGRLLGCTDVEMVRSLEVDTCPGFVSDGEGGVRWVNPAYRRMVGGGIEEEVVVWLVVKGGRLPVERGGFSCRVKVVYGGRDKQKKKKVIQTVPCDVWRMFEFGGFAWRLDLQAALTLAPLNP